MMRDGCGVRAVRINAPIELILYPTRWGKFVSPMDENGRGIMTDDSHIHSLTISKIRDTPWVWPTRLGGDKPLNNREVFRAMGRMGFLAFAKGYKISDHVVADDLWRIAPTFPRYWISHHSATLYMGSLGESFENEGGDTPSSQTPESQTRVPFDVDIVFRAGASGPPIIGAFPTTSILIYRLVHTCLPQGQIRVLPNGFCWMN